MRRDRVEYFVWGKSLYLCAKSWTEPKREIGTSRSDHDQHQVRGSAIQLERVLVGCFGLFVVKTTKAICSDDEKEMMY